MNDSTTCVVLEFTYGRLGMVDPYQSSGWVSGPPHMTSEAVLEAVVIHTGEVSRNRRAIRFLFQK